MFRKQKPPIGARPGTLVIEQGSPPPRIRVITFTPQKLEESDVTDVLTLAPLVGGPSLFWVDVQGLGDARLLQRIGEMFSIHPLALEDVTNVPIRPKADAYDHQLLLVTRMLRLERPDKLGAEQVSIVVGRGYVLTFQQLYGDVLDPVRNRLRQGNGRLRSAGPDYLAYAILDTIIDSYYPLIEHIGDALEDFEEEVLQNPGPDTLRRLHRMRHMLLAVRRAVSPQREAVNSLIRDENALFGRDVRIYLRDTYDHCVHTAEAAENCRELISELMNTYLTVVSNRTNEIMKVLTIVASIFVPLTFMAGVYGMNFEHMPELRSRWGYPALLVAMAFVAGGMLIYFRRNGWLGGTRQDDDDAP